MAITPNSLHGTALSGAPQQAPTLVPSSLGLLIQNLLGRRPAHHPLHPSVVVGVVLLHLFHLPFVTEEERGHRAPSDKGEIGIGALVADEVLFTLESLVQDAVDADDLLLVALDGGLEALVMEIPEPVQSASKHPQCTF